MPTLDTGGGVEHHEIDRVPVRVTPDDVLVGELLGPALSVAVPVA
jgi:hypothetical protein